MPYPTQNVKSLINLLAYKINMISQREIFVNHSRRRFSFQGTVINGTYWSLKWGAFFSFFEFAISINLDLKVLRVSSFSFSQQVTFFRSIFSLCCKSCNQEEEYRTALRHKQIRQEMHTVKTCGQLQILSCALSTLSFQFASRSVVLLICFQFPWFHFDPMGGLLV